MPYKKKFMNNDWISVNDKIPNVHKIVQAKLNNGETILAIREQSDHWHMWSGIWNETTPLFENHHYPKYWRLIDKKHSKKSLQRFFNKVKSANTKDWESFAI